jgi:hypothetical protein
LFDLPSSQDDLVFKLTSAMNVHISLAWVHEFVQFVIVLYDCSELQSIIVPPMSLTHNLAKSAEDALHILSQTLSDSTNQPREREDSHVAKSNTLKFGTSAFGLSEAVFSLCVSILCCDLTSCEGAKASVFFISFDHNRALTHSHTNAYPHSYNSRSAKIRS